MLWVGHVPTSRRRRPSAVARGLSCLALALIGLLGAGEPTAEVQPWRSLLQAMPEFNHDADVQMPNVAEAPPQQAILAALAFAMQCDEPVLHACMTAVASSFQALQMRPHGQEQ